MGTISKAQRQRIFREAQGLCVYCGDELEEADFHIDHAVPRAIGGKGGPNLVAACPYCNMKKYDRTPGQFKYYLLKDTLSTFADSGRQVYKLIRMMPPEDGNAIIAAMNTIYERLTNADLRFFHEDMLRGLTYADLP